MNVLGEYHTGIAVSIKVCGELAELVNKMVGYGIAQSRLHTFNIAVERGLAEDVKAQLPK